MAVFRMDYPPTVNTYWRNWKGRMVLSARGRAYRESALGLTEEILTGHVQVSIGVTFPDHRKRDIDNLTKGILDAISYAGVLSDDSQVKALLIYWTGLVGQPGCVDVTVEPWEESLWNGSSSPP